MRPAVRDHFRNPPAGSKLRAAVDFGVDITLMAPPQFSDRSGHRAKRSFGPILRALHDNGVECVIVGGVALVLHGATRVTLDLDVLYERSAENIERLVRAVARFAPRLRADNGEPIDAPFLFDVKTVAAGANFTLYTEEFDLDLLAATDDLPSYAAIIHQAQRIHTVDGMSFDVLSLEALLRIKKRLNRIKDQLAIPEIEALIEVRDLERGDAEA